LKSKKIILVGILCFIFIVGTFSIVGAAEAAKWKKIDSGKFKTEYPPEGYKKLVYYQTFAKGENKLYYDTYFYPKNDSTKKLSYRITMTKNKNMITEKRKDYFSNEIKIVYHKTKLTAKKFFKNSIKDTINLSAIPPNKLAFDKWLFTVNKTDYKIYGIKQHKNNIISIVYKDKKEYCTFEIYKQNNKIIYKEYNQKRKLSSKESFKAPNTPMLVFKNKIDKIIKKTNLKLKSKNEAVEQAKLYLNDAGIDYISAGSAKLVKSDGKQYWLVGFIERDGRPGLMYIDAPAN